MGARRQDRSAETAPAAAAAAAASTASMALGPAGIAGPQALPHPLQALVREALPPKAPTALPAR